MYKLIAIDLDGTLLNSYGEVTELNKKAIEYAISKGIEVILASGRDPQTMKKMSKELGIENYLIAGNGANIYDIKAEKNIYENFIKKEKALEIIKICKENSIFFNVYTNVGIITETINYNVNVFNNENSHRPNNKRTNIEIVDSVYNYISNNNLEILKIIICDNSKIIFNNIRQKLKTVKGIEVLEVEHMSKKIIKDGTDEYKVEYYYTEVTNCNANKWNTIEKLIQKLNINKEEVICIGDNMNDLEMITNAGLGIIMKNSALEKRNIAKYITDDNNSDGVGKAIYKFI